MAEHKLSSHTTDHYQLHKKLEGDAFLERWAGTHEGQTVLVKILPSLEKESLAIWEDWGLRMAELPQKKAPPQVQLPIAWGYVDEQSQQPYVILPFERGVLLSAEKGKATEAELAKLLLEMAQALSWLHQQEKPVLHHGIHPNNMLRQEDGSYKLLDLGLAGPLRRQQGQGIGNWRSWQAYFAPEYFEEQGVGTAADIFALGVSLYEMAVGELPLGKHGGRKLLDGGEIPELPAGFSPRFNQILQVMMAKGANRRPDANTLIRLGKLFQEQKEWKSVSGFSFAPAKPYRPPQKNVFRLPALPQPSLPAKFWKQMTWLLIAVVFFVGGWQLWPLVQGAFSRSDEPGLVPVPIETQDSVATSPAPPPTLPAFPLEPTVKELVREFGLLKQTLDNLPAESLGSQADRTFLKLTRMKMSTLQDEIAERLIYAGEEMNVIAGWKGTPDAVWVQDALGRVNRYQANLELMDLEEANAGQP